MRRLAVAAIYRDESSSAVECGERGIDVPWTAGDLRCSAVPLEPASSDVGVPLPQNAVVLLVGMNGLQALFFLCQLPVAVMLVFAAISVDAYQRTGDRRDLGVLVLLVASVIGVA